MDSFGLICLYIYIYKSGMVGMVDPPWDIIVSHAALRNHEFE